MDTPQRPDISNPHERLGISHEFSAGEAMAAVQRSADQEYALRCLANIGTHAAVQALIELSKTPVVALRRRTTYFMGLVESDDGIQRLIELLDDPDLRIRVEAHNALIDHSSSAVGTALLPLLTAAPTRVRAVAVDILGHLLESQGALSVSRNRIEVDPIITALGAALNDEAPEVRLEAARALEKAGPLAVHAITALATALTDSDHRVRARAIAGLKGVQSPEAMLLLEEVGLARIEEDLCSHDPHIQEAAANAARHIGRKAVPPLINALRTANDTVRFAIALSLRHMQADALFVVESLLPLIAEEGRVQHNGVRVLQEIGTPAALRAIEIYLEDMPEDPQDKVLRTMEAWARRSATSRVSGYRLEYGELVRVDGARLRSPIDRQVQAFAERAILELGDALSQVGVWDVTLEEDIALVGLTLRPRGGMERDVDTSGPTPPGAGGRKLPSPGVGDGCARPDRGGLEVVFERDTRNLVLIIGAPA